MDVRITASPLRCLAVALAATAGLVALLAVLAGDLAAAGAAARSGSTAGQPFATLLEWLCAAAGAAVAVWLWSGTVAVAARAARGRVSPTTGALPPPLRRLVLLACGVALASGLAVPAHASVGQAGAGDLRPGHTERETHPLAATLGGLPLPARPTGAGPAPRLRPPPPLHRADAVRVRPGDTLWALAQSAMPGPADDVAVTRRWRRLYALNRPVVGPDPDLIQPGEQLRLPHR